MLTLRELKRSIEFRSAYGELPVTYMDHDARHFSGSSPANKIAKKLFEVKKHCVVSNEGERFVQSLMTLSARNSFVFLFLDAE